jgi:hypothetical protein
MPHGGHDVRQVSRQGVAHLARLVPGQIGGCAVNRRLQGIRRRQQQAFQFGAALIFGPSLAPALPDLLGNFQEDVRREVSGDTWAERSQHGSADRFQERRRCVHAKTTITRAAAVVSISGIGASTYRYAADRTGGPREKLIGRIHAGA